MEPWYQQDLPTILEHFKTDPQSGLSASEVAVRLAQYGPNELVEQGRRSPWKILWEQLTSIMVIILIVAAVISALIGDLEDAIAILAIVVLNAALGFQQEYKAEQSIAALKKMAVPTVRARRNGAVVELVTRELVPGDVVSLETGNLIPADGRVLESINLRVEEAALTGESVAVDKEAHTVYNDEKALGDRRNMLYMGTIVTYGRGEFLVTETGMETELGHIANLIQSVEEESSPLQQRLDRVGKALAGVALGIVAVIFLLGILRGENLEEMFLVAVSLAVAAVPEALPAVATIALALGAQRMLKRRALIRKLPAVETLGSVNVICSDKTGTLTKNQMSVTVLDIAEHRLDLKTRPDGKSLEIVPVDEPPLSPGGQAMVDMLLAGGTLCNDARVQTDPQDPEHYLALGDPTESAIVLAAAEVGIRKDELERAFPRIQELPFDSVRKRMTTLHSTPDASADLPGNLGPLWLQSQGGRLPEHVAFTKGAIDGLLEISTQVLVEGRLEPLDETWRARVLSAHDRLAANGMRILGVGTRPVDDLPADLSELEADLILIGLIGMVDPPRPEVKDAIAICKTAGIRTVMITGDHPLTARHIASQLGIHTGDRFLTGQELDRLTPEAFSLAAQEINIFARVSPEHKLRLVEELQAQGNVTAMTGDGVNDAPALKKADIGVAMGITGTDVSKSAADMVLLDDNFATIVAAVEEGRVIYENIRKFIRYLLSCNSAEIAVMLFGPLLGMPLPLLPLQILWMNLVTDGMPALALGVEPAEKDVMQRPPNPPSAKIFDRALVTGIIWVGLFMSVVSLVVGYLYFINGSAAWQTMIFTTLTLSQLALALTSRAERVSLWSIGLFTNPPMVGALLLTFVLQLGVIYLPFFQRLMRTVPLSLPDLGISIGACLVVLIVVELAKLLFRRGRSA